MGCPAFKLESKIVEVSDRRRGAIITPIRPHEVEEDDAPQFPISTPKPLERHYDLKTDGNITRFVPLESESSSNVENSRVEESSVARHN